MTQNPLKSMDSTTISNLPIPFEKFVKSKNFTNNHQTIDVSDQSNEGKNSLMNVKRKSIGGIDEYESVYLKKIKSDISNSFKYFCINTFYHKVGSDERKFSRNSSDFAWIENESAPSVVEENSYNPEDLPEISKKIEKMVIFYYF